MLKYNISGTGFNTQCQAPEFLNKYKEYKNKHNKQLILIVTVGRSGTRWLSEIFNSHNSVEGSCEPENFAELFYRYVKWNDLPIDLTGVYNLIANKAFTDWKKADLSVIASPGLSIDFLDIMKQLEVDKIIWGVNDAKFTITSFYNKGWYDNEICIQNPNLAVGLQPFFRTKETRSLGRLIPKGDSFYEWKKLTQIGKISWFYSMYNMKIFEQIEKIDRQKVWIFKLEEADQNYEYYLSMVLNFNLTPTLTEEEFLALKKEMANDQQNKQKEWDLKETEEFEHYIKEFHEIYDGLKN
jgi:hypothetical protein